MPSFGFSVLAVLLAELAPAPESDAAAIETPSDEAPADEAQVESQPMHDPAVDEAAHLFDEGRLSYETSDYSAAVKSFTDAYRVASNIRDDQRRDGAMTLLLFNLAQAHAKAYEVDKDTTHLRTARDLLERYLAYEEELGNELDAEALLRQIETALSAAAESGAPEGTEPAPTPAPGNGVRSDRPQTNGLLIGGAVTAGLAAPALAAMIVGLEMGTRAKDDFFAGPTLEDRNAALSRGKTGNALAVGGGIGAAVFAGVGVALIVVGQKRARSTARLQLGPGPGLVGARLSGRF